MSRDKVGEGRGRFEWAAGDAAHGVPRLRFPEFGGSCAWEERRLGEISDIKTGPFGSVLHESDYVDVGTPIITVEHLGELKVEGGNAPRISDLDKIRLSAYVLNEGDIVFSRVGSVDRCAIIGSNEEGWLFSGRLLRLRVTAKNSSPGFLNQLLKYKPNKVKIRDSAVGQTMPSLNTEILKKISFLMPSSFLEQQKIVSCLSSLDDLITAETQKLDTLKAHKKGLMQQLFPAEGETVPRLRFPEFRGAGEWREKKAGTLFKNRKEKGKAGLPIYSVTMNDGLVKRSSLDRKIDDIAKPEGNRKAYRNDIAYNMMRMWQGAFGIVPEDCMVSPAYVILSPQDGVHSNFFGYLLKLPRSLQFLTSHSRGLTSDRLRLYYDDFAAISLRCPAFSEQQRIADCFSSIDNLITAQIQKLTTLKAHKKGLMQQLFPAPDEPQR